MNFKRVFTATISAASFAWGVPVLAADLVPTDQKPLAPTATTETEPELVEVVVTGTQIRGVAPTGSNVIALSSEDIVATGASNASQILAHIPEVTTSFNATPSPGSGPLTTISRPDIRNLNGNVGGFGAGGNATLVLVDGHRIVGAGTSFETPDPDAIPAAMIERVEVVPDGGSSIYGSDAVGGVINFITKKKFDGVEIALRGGGAGSYHTLDGSISAGQSWDSGSVFGSFSDVDHNAIYGHDVSYAVSPRAQSGACYPGTVSTNSGGMTTTYAIPGLVPGTSSACDVASGSTIYPSEHRRSFFAGLNQDITSQLRFDLRAFYTDRRLTSAEDPNGRNFIEVGQTITPANPYYTPVPNDPGTQNVSFSFAGVADTRSRTEIEEWGVTPTLTYELESGWQIRLMGNYGRSTTTAYNLAINAGPEAAAIAGTNFATALDPYNVSLTNPGVLSLILSRNYQDSSEELMNGRVIADGSLFRLPGGDLKLAVGAEINNTSVKRGADATLTEAEYSVNDYSAVLTSTSHRTVSSGFGEFSIPVFGLDNAAVGVQALTLSLSGRYDHYSDFGSTTNPKIGLSYKPIQSITLHGNFGKSFTAPALIDTTTVGSLTNVLPFSPFLAPGAPAGSSGRPTIFILGGNPNLQPQTATTYSFGADFKPEFARGLDLSATYYHVLFKNQIAFTNFQSPDLYSGIYGSTVILNPTQAQATAIAAQTQTLAGTPSIASLYSGATTPYVLIDTRKANLGQLKVNGIDFSATYVLPMSFGSLNFAASGTYGLKRDFAPSATASFVNQFEEPGFSRFNFVGSVGASIGNVNTSFTLNHSSGYDINPAVVYDGGGIIPGGTQPHIDSFDTVDYFLAWDVHGEAMLSNLQLTLTVNNLLNEKPPFYGASDFGYGNGATLGRLIQVGFKKKIL